MLSVLTYGYATVVFSSRKLEAATHDLVAFRYVAANLHPDHDTLNTFRKCFLPQIATTDVPQEQVQRVVDRLNHRLRKVLGFRTSYEVFFGKTVRYTKPPSGVAPRS